MSALALQSFGFEGNTVRVVDQADSPWFVAQDVCACVEIANHWNAVGALDEDEKGLHTVETLGGPQQVSIISESGLYALIFKSRKPAAIRFRKWVTSEVLPTLRRTGRYVLGANDAAQDVEDRFVLDSPEKGERIRTEVLMMRIAQQAAGRKGLRRMYALLGCPSLEEEKPPMLGQQKLWRVVESVIDWSRERLVPHEDGVRWRIRLREAHADYERWCAARGESPISLVAFGKAMPSLGVRTMRSGGSWIIGLNLAD